MRTFKNHLEKKIKDKEFQTLFKEEKILLEISLKITDARKHSGLSQQALAKKAHITQQQLSKIESGLNCNMKTFLKVCYALGMKIDIDFHSYQFAN
ncbi:MAG TPA: XRE family transcriptional regulator [Candidatus Cloacimonetes bacterium]|nr:XRE family transcriptional regulator [Candidatus Cloacimonadota bacterium]